MGLSRGRQLVLAVAGLAVPAWTLCGVPFLVPAWLTRLPLLLFNPVDLAGPLPVEWGCFGPTGDAETAQLGLIVLIAESLWSVSVGAVASIALLSYLAHASADPKAKRLARTYSLSAQLALLSFFSALQCALQAIASQ